MTLWLRFYVTWTVLIYHFSDVTLLAKVIHQSKKCMYVLDIESSHYQFYERYVNSGVKP